MPVREKSLRKEQPKYMQGTFSELSVRSIAYLYFISIYKGAAGPGGGICLPVSLPFRMMRKVVSLSLAWATQHHDPEEKNV